MQTIEIAYHSAMGKYWLTKHNESPTPETLSKVLTHMESLINALRKMN